MQAARNRSPARGSPKAAALGKKEEVKTASITYKNGAVYKGEINDKHERHGKDGKLTMPGGEAEYFGEFENTRFINGTLTYSKDCWFKGTFDDNNQFEQGTFHKGNTEYTGKFKNQKMVGEFTVKWTSGIEYVGPVQDNKLNGTGNMYFPEGYNIKHIHGVWEAD